MLNNSYKANKKANILTFRNSYLYEPFEKIHQVYNDYKNKERWNSCSEERKKEDIMPMKIHVFACKKIRDV